MSLALLLLAARTASAGDWHYTVQPGDNLWNLAERYLISVESWQRIQQINHVADPWNLPPGSDLRIPTSLLRKGPGLARVTEVQGKAEIIEPESGHSQPVRPGALLAPQDELITGADGNLTIEFVDGSRILMQANSRMQVEQLRMANVPGIADARLRLEQGRVETQVTPNYGSPNRFEIATPSAVTSVRGTNFRVAADASNAESKSEVLRGAVAVRGQSTTRQVPAGFGTIVARGRPPRPPKRLLPAPNLADVPVLFERSPIRASIPALPGQSGLRAQVSPTEDFASLNVDQIVSGGDLKLPDLPDGRYFLRARAIDREGLEGVSGQMRFTLNARPEPPFLVQPQPQAAVVDERPAFSWSKSAGIAGYRFQLAADAQFTHLLAEAETGDAAGITSDPILPLGTYFWRVAAIDSKEGAGPFSDSQTFRRVNTPPAVDDPEVADETVVIRWRAGLPGQTYQVQMSEQEDFGTLLVDARTAEPQHPMQRPEGGSYFVRARTVDPDGFEGPFGVPQEIDIPSKTSYYWWLLALPLFALFAL